MTRIQSFSLVGALAVLLVIAWLSSDRGRPLPSATPVRAPAPHEHIASSAGPDELFSAFADDPKWRALETSGSAFSVSYVQRPFGELRLEGARLAALPDGAYQVRADALSMGSAVWHDLTFSLRRRVDTIELRQAPSADYKALEINYTKGRGGALWALTLPHQPAHAALMHYAPELAPESARTQLLASLSLAAPQTAENPVRGNLEVVLDAWSHPDWPDAQALLGDTLSLGARVEPSELGAIWPLQDVRVSTLLFTLSGKGQIEWRRAPALQLDVAGSLSCRQLAANLAPSVYLDDLKRFLASAAPAEQSSKVELRLHVDIDGQAGRREVVWRLGGGCGLSAR